MTQAIVTGSFRGAWQTFTAYRPGDVLHYLGTEYTVTAAFTSGAVFDSTNLSHVGSSTDDLTVTAVGKGLRVKEGSNAKMGTAVLVAGSKVVNTTGVTANSRIFVTSNVDGGTPGWLRVSARTPGTSFTITSSSGTDTSTVAWMIVEPAP